MGDTLELVGQMLAYAGVGLVVLLLGFFVLDLLTPGKLGELVMNRNPNAAIIASANLVSLGLVLWFAIFFSGTGSEDISTAWNGLDDVAIFGVVAVALQAISFIVLDVLTPGKLGSHVTETTFHPASVVSASLQVAVAFIICASLT
ncbi:MAG: DUF350 domain-containing protein [Solirubrobacteraceae bacterium]|nr:DUF350 domain-containing protein [Solirubrobacteraceae bacterium]